MAVLKSVATYMVLSALLAVCLSQSAQGGPHVSQGSPHQDQGRTRRQVADENPEEVNLANGIGPNPLNPLNWTSCDVTVIPKISCHDCKTRVICKPIGGLLRTCNNPARPHCNMGICSAVPSANCA